MPVHIFQAKQQGFVLWHLANGAPPPKLIIGEFAAGNPPTLKNQQTFALTLLAGTSDLWGTDAAACGLADGKVYHYWFELTDSDPNRTARIQCTDPMAYTVDWRLFAPSLPAPYTASDQDPASVIKFKQGALIACDAAGETFNPATLLASGKPNNEIVIYELPTSWSKINVNGDPQIGVGTFRDVMALVDASAAGANFAGTAALRPGRSHFDELGVNALELLPIADSFVEREWGYAPSNYFARISIWVFPKGTLHQHRTPI